MGAPAPFEEKIRGIYNGKCNGSEGRIVVFQRVEVCGTARSKNFCNGGCKTALTGPVAGASLSTRSRYAELSAMERAANSSHAQAVHRCERSEARMGNGERKRALQRFKHSDFVNPYMTRLR